MDSLINEVERGIYYEEEFIVMYLDIIKHKDVLEVFSDQEKAKELLEKLVAESTAHKKILQKFLAKLLKEN